MENKKDLFDLNLNVVARQHLLESAKWARFLAIAGFVLLVLLVAWSVYIILTPANYPQDDLTSEEYMLGTMVGCLIMGLTSFFPCLFLLRFANKMKEAIHTDNTELLTDSLRNLKIMFRYVGVLTIIMLILFFLGVVGMIGNEMDGL